MNQELPKSLREALARQTAGDAHPSPDVLTAFVEHSLLGRENQRVTDHLAKCKDCREVVFLASSTAEEPVGEEQEWMPAAAVPRISPALLAKAEGAQATASAAQANAPTRRGWMLRWVGVPAVAVIALVSAVLIRQTESPRAAPQHEMLATKAPPTAAMNDLTSVEPESQAKAAPPKPIAKSVRPQTKPAQNSDTLASASGASKAATEYRSAPAEMAGSTPPSPPPPGTLAYQSSLQSVPRQNNFVEGETPAVSGMIAKSQFAPEKPQAAMLPAVITRRQWRVTPDGHVEHSTAPGGWTAVLTDQPATFHALSVVGNNVWAGGAGGGLFHSKDGGQNWSKAELSSASGAETSTIVSIRFSDALNGVIATEAGSHWTTSDGGVTWTKA